MRLFALAEEMMPTGFALACRFLSTSVDLVQADAGRFDRVAPFFDFGREKLGQIILGPSIGSDGNQAEHLQPILHRGAVERSDGRIMELFDDCGGCTLGQEEGVPVSGFEIDEALLVGGSERR